MKEQIWLTNVQYLMTATEYFVGIISIFIDTPVCTIPKLSNIKKEKEICLPNKEYIGDH